LVPTKQEYILKIFIHSFIRSGTLDKGNTNDDNTLRHQGKTSSRHSKKASMKKGGGLICPPPGNGFHEDRYFNSNIFFA
jgi:hypothetical protein